MNFSMGGGLKQYWMDCERQLFAMTGMEAEQYQRIVKAIRSVSDVLKDISSVDELEAAWADAETLYKKAAADFGFPPQALPHEKVAGAAFALRERQIGQENQRSQAINAIKDARADGQDWVILNETGNLEHGLMDPYHCTEMNLQSGLAIVSITQADPTGASTLYVLSVVRLDADSGQLVDAEPGIEDWLEHATPDELQKARIDLRTKIAAAES